MIKAGSFLLTKTGPLPLSEAVVGQELLTIVETEDGSIAFGTTKIVKIEEVQDVDCVKLNDLEFGKTNCICLPDASYVGVKAARRVVSTLGLNDGISQSQIYHHEDHGKCDLVKLMTTSKTFLVGPTKYGPFFALMCR